MEINRNLDFEIKRKETELARLKIKHKQANTKTDELAKN